MILITNNFNKQLEKIKSVSLENILSEIQKHKSGLDNFIEIGYIKNRKVLKGYLLSKKVRIIILLKEKNNNYLPFYIVKKETKFGKNIRKESLKELNIKLEKIFLDLKEGNYKIYYEKTKK